MEGQVGSIPGWVVISGSGMCEEEKAGSLKPGPGELLYSEYAGWVQSQQTI